MRISPRGEKEGHETRKARMLEGESIESLTVCHTSIRSRSDENSRPHKRCDPGRSLVP